MDTYISLNKKLVITILLLLCFLMVLGLLSMYSIVTIKGIGNDNKSVYIHWGNADNQRKIFNLTNGSKTFIFRKQPVTIEVTSADKKSIYKKNIGGFLKQEISIETKPKKKSLALGVNALKCATLNDSEQTIYYPCSPALGSSINVNTQGTSANIVLNDLVPSEEYRGLDTSDITSLILPYKNGFISVVSVAENLYIGEYTLTGNRIGEPIKIRDFASTVNENLVSIINNGEKPTLAILNTVFNSLYLFDDPQDSNPDIVKLPDDLSEHTDTMVKTILSSPSSIYVVAYRDPSILETHDHEGNEDREFNKEVSNTSKGQFVTEIKISDKSIKTYELPKELLIRKITASHSGEIAFLPHYSDTKQYIYLWRNGKLSNLPFAINDVDKICWTKSNELFFSVSGSSDIYKYSFDTHGSFLMYSNSNASLKTISCDFDKLTFSLDVEGDGLISEVSHFLLTDNDSEGKPLEEVLPIYIDLPSNTGVIKVTQDSNSVFIGLVYSDGVLLSKDEILQLVKDRLEALQIKTKDLQIIFNF